jgi:translation elongation factor Ts
MATALLRRTSPHRPWASLLAAAFSTESAVQIKALRERTGAPIKDVKAALQQCGWDAEAAIMELRKKGLTAASRKTSRTATDGLLAVASNSHGVTAVVEINSETDFVARNEMFRHLATRVARAALGVHGDHSASGNAASIDLHALQAVRMKLEHEKLSGEATVQEAVTEVAAIVAENVVLRRGFLVSSSPSGIVSSYLHASAHPGLARVVGLVTLESEQGSLKNEEAELGTALAMHVVAAKPLFLSKDVVPETFLHRETDIFRSQALASGKPANVVEKMVQGRLRKYFEETVLLDQKFVINDAVNVQAVLNDHHKQTGRRVGISNFFEDGSR